MAIMCPKCITTNSEGKTIAYPMVPIQRVNIQRPNAVVEKLWKCINPKCDYEVK